MNIKRKTTLASVLTAAVLMLAACGGSTPSTTPTADTAGTPAASASGAKPGTTTSAPDPNAKRTITDANGKQVEVPANPQRVVALSETDLDVMLALGLKPVGTISGRGQASTPRYLGDKPAGIPIVGTVSQPTVEKIIELGPDLILAGSLADEQVLAQLSAVAPTVNTAKAGEDWKTLTARIATALNQEAAGKDWLAKYDQKVKEIKSKLGAHAGAEVSVVRWNPAGPIYMGPHLFTSQVLAELGLKRPAHQYKLPDGQAHSPALSLEMLNQLDGDWLFLGTLNPDGDAAMKTAMETPAFRQLNVVKNNRVVLVDGTAWSSSQGPNAAMGILAVIEQNLVGK